jgi:aarF domain-containing kinase
MVVMRANSLIRNITKKLAEDIQTHNNLAAGGEAGDSGGSKKAGRAGRGWLGLSLGGFIGGDVGRRMERRRQWQGGEG